ncbi:BREX-1 system adenine-specific DNA-methyltransferase PglX, partial [Salmonella enterica]|nr:BREX-1 system adenine-specific DNA-methyltransferase PglX [Salmonella enterica]
CFPDSKSDLFAMFMQNGFNLLKTYGLNAQINMQAWMFLSSYEMLRHWLIHNKTLVTMAHLGARAFSEITGEVVQTTAWVIQNSFTELFQPVFFRLVDGNDKVKKKMLLNKHERYTKINMQDLAKIPGSPIVYWMQGIENFSRKKLSQFFLSGGRNKTHNNELYVRYFWEVSLHAKKWVGYANGGEAKRYYGNNEFVIDWSDEAKSFYNSHGGLSNSKFWNKIGITWSLIGTNLFAFRIKPCEYQYSSGSPVIFCENLTTTYVTLAFLNSFLAKYYLSAISPTINTTVNDILSLPVPELETDEQNKIIELVNLCLDLGTKDWDSLETSPNFMNNPLIAFKGDVNKLSELNNHFIIKNQLQLEKISDAEYQINTIFINNFNVTQHIKVAKNLKNITLNSNLFYRYGNNDEDSKKRYQSDLVSEFISYLIGCMVGRYSLDREGLVYAHEGNQGFADLVAERAYKTFPADNDGILPLMDDAWFDDDVTTRVKEFVRTVWGEEHLQENLEFIAESLCLYAIKPKKGEPALDTIRRYLSTQFWKDHLKMYKKRPIYWLFSSGKEKAFECLVYLHRYNDATLARMRTEYVVPLLARYQANIDRLNEQIDTSSGGEATRLKRERDSLSKKFNELRSFDDRLRHYADMRITLDLDDGVKVNYGKFGDLLADVKAITGNAPEII